MLPLLCPTSQERPQCQTSGINHIQTISVRFKIYLSFYLPQDLPSLVTYWWLKPCFMLTKLTKAKASFCKFLSPPLCAQFKFLERWPCHIIFHSKYVLYSLYPLRYYILLSNFYSFSYFKARSTFPHLSSISMSYVTKFHIPYSQAILKKAPYGHMLRKKNGTPLKFNTVHITSLCFPFRTTAKY